MCMKKCTLCLKPKSLDEFPRNKQTKDGRYAHCKKCHSKTMRDSYHRDPDAKLEDCKRRRRALIEITSEIKSKSGCKLCSESDPCCLDFHHSDPTKKDVTIALLVTRKSKEKMLKEIEKCVIVCANCHRKLHAGRIKLTIGVAGSTSGSEPESVGSNPASSANFYAKRPNVP